jgi:membrane protein DedA with SNARE-associated domain
LNGINQQVEVILINQIAVITGSSQAFITGHPVLSTLILGLLFALSSVIGETILYWAARLGGRPLVLRFSRWLRLDTRHMDRVEDLFSRWGLGLVLFGRVLPGVRTLVSVPAGMSRMNFGLYLGASFSAGYVYNTLWFAASYFFGYKLTMFGLSIF